MQSTLGHDEQDKSHHLLGETGLATADESNPVDCSEDEERTTKRSSAMSRCYSGDEESRSGPPLAFVKLSLNGYSLVPRLLRFSALHLSTCRGS